MLVCYAVLLRQISLQSEMKVRFLRSPQNNIEGIRPDEELVLKTSSGSPRCEFESHTLCCFQI